VRIAFLGKPKRSATTAASWLRNFAHFNGIEAVFPRDHFDVPECGLLVSFLYPMRIAPDVVARAGLALNFHPAPLPRYRGLWGCSRAILDGATKFGVTAHVLAPEIDAGDVVASLELGVLPEDTAATLDHRAQDMLFALFRDTMLRFAAGQALPRTPQTSDAPKPPTRAELEAMKEIFADDPAERVDRKARAFWNPPYPGARLRLGGEWFTVAPRVVAAGGTA